MISLEEYKNYLISSYRYETDNTEEKRKERSIILESLYSNEELERIINDTYDFINDMLNSETIEFGYYKEILDNKKIEYIFLNSIGDAFADIIYYDKNNRRISKYIMHYIFGKYLDIVVRYVDVEKYDKDDYIVIERINYLYIQNFSNNLKDVKDNLFVKSFKKMI